jgi:hypothetical protein
VARAAKKRQEKILRVKGFDYKKPTYAAVYVERNQRLLKIRNSPKFFVAAKKYYANNPADFINDWGMTTDPRKKISVFPFLLWPEQREFIDWVKVRFDAKEDGLVEKTRDAGVTWLCVAFAVHMWLFQGNAKIGFGSRKETLVDRIGDPDSIFEKIRFFIRGLPVEFFTQRL